jgi:formimidoylglutamate deiminase
LAELDGRAFDERAGGGTVCLCPLTEGNLGDGIAGLAGIREPGGAICLGSDSNARISMLEEMRWMEYAQRLATESRGVLRDGSGHNARILFESATVTGARTVGVYAGRLPEPICGGRGMLSIGWATSERPKFS